MKIKKSRILSLVLALVMILGSTVAFAAEGDYFLKSDGSPIYNSNQIRVDASAKNHVRVSPQDFLIEIGAVKYDFTAARAAYAQDPINWKANLAGGTEEPTADLKVVEVSAINANVALAGSTVKPNESFKVTFSTEVDEATVTSANVALKQGSLTLGTKITVAEDKKSVTIKPEVGLEIKSDFTLTLNNIKSVDGEQTIEESTTAFKTADALVVTAVKADSAAYGAAKEIDKAVSNANAANIYVDFSKSLDANTVNTSTVKLYNVTDEVYVAENDSAVAYNVAGKYITFEPTPAQIIGNKQYKLVIAGVKALDGTSIDDYEKAFSIGSSVPFTANDGKIVFDTAANMTQAGSTVYNTLPTAKSIHGQANVADTLLNPFSFRIAFGRDMDAATLTEDNFKVVKLDKEGKVVANSEAKGVITYDAATYAATWKPADALEEQQDYAVLLTDDITDANKIAITVPDNEIVKTFTTGDFTAPTITKTNITNGQTGVAIDTKIKLTFSEKVDISTLVGSATGQDAVRITLTGGTSESITLENVTDDTAVNLSGGSVFSIDPIDTTGKTVLINPGALTNNKNYKLVVKGSNYSDFQAVADENGVVLGSDYTLVFKTAEVSAPKIVAAKGISANSPAATATTNLDLTTGTASAPVIAIQGAGSVAANEIIEVKFDNVMDNSAGDAKDVTVPANYKLNKWNPATGKYDTAVAAPFTTAWTAGTKTVKLTPTGASVFDATSDATTEAYELVIPKTLETATGKAMTEDVKLYFSTSFKKPAVATVKAGTGGSFGTTLYSSSVINPTNIAASDIDDGILEITFLTNQKLQTSTLTAANVEVKDLTEDKVISGALYEDVDTLFSTASKVSADNEIFWQAAEGGTDLFKAGHTYQIKLTGVKDRVFASMQSDFITTFRVAGTAAPTVEASTPENGSVGVAVDSTSTVKFATAMDASTITNATVGLSSDGADIDVPAKVTFDAVTNTATITPDAYLKVNTDYSIIYKTGAQTADGVGTVATVNLVGTFQTSATAKTPKMTSAVYKATTHTLTITFDKKVASAVAGVTLGTAPADSILIAGGSDGTAAATGSLSTDGKTLVLKFQPTAAVYDETILPGVTTIAIQSGATTPIVGAKQFTGDAAGVNFSSTPVTVTE